jgi:hypothetical protein
MRARGVWRKGHERLFGLLAAVFAVGALALPGAALAADRNGVVVEVQTKERTFTLESGKGVHAAVTTFQTDPATKITFGKKIVPFGNLVPGYKVSVRYRDRDLGPLATAVEIHHLGPAR